jgi:hypothetical protein
MLVESVSEIRYLASMMLLLLLCPTSFSLVKKPHDDAEPPEERRGIPTTFSPPLLFRSDNISLPSSRSHGR